MPVRRCNRLRPAALCLLLVFQISLAIACAVGPALAESASGKRVALVIGNAKYQNIPALGNPANDAELVASTLNELGFSLVGGRAQLNLTKPDLDRAIQLFGRSLSDTDVAVFYYAGHGVQVGGHNYLVPIDANPTREVDVDFQMLDLNLALRQMEGSGSRLNLVVLDACRNNPFGGSGLRVASNGLAEMRSPEGTLVSFATQPGNVALDGIGANSPFTIAFAESIVTPGLDVFRLFNEIGLKVAEATGGQQKPWFSSSPIKGKFFLAGPPAGEEEEIAPKEKRFDAFAPAQVEIAYWESISDSKISALYEAYLQRYPGGQFADLARIKIGLLDADQKREANKRADTQRLEEEKLSADKAKQEHLELTRRAVENEERRPPIEAKIQDSENYFPSEKVKLDVLDISMTKELQSYYEGLRGGRYSFSLSLDGWEAAKNLRFGRRFSSYYGEIKDAARLEIKKKGSIHIDELIDIAKLILESEQEIDELISESKRKYGAILYLRAFQNGIAAFPNVNKKEYNFRRIIRQMKIAFPGNSSEMDEKLFERIFRKTFDELVRQLDENGTINSKDIIRKLRSNIIAG